MDELQYQPPQNIEAEQEILGAILTDSPSLMKITEISPSDFYKNAHQIIYKTMISLAEKREPIDLVTVKAELNGNIETVGGQNYLMGLAINSITSANIQYHAKIVKEASLKRQVIMACREAVADVFSESLDVALTTLRKKVQGLTTGYGGKIVTMLQVSKDVYDFVEHRSKHRDEISGIPSGFKDIDQLTDGFQPGDFIILAARPGNGKSALSMAFAQNARVPVGFISLEMVSHQLGVRTLSSLSQVELWRLRKGFIKDEHWGSITSAFVEMAKLPIFFSFTSRNTAQIEKVVTQMIENHGIKMLIVDYLQLARAVDIKKREQEVAEVSRLLKTLSQIHNIPVIALAQLNREVEKRENKKPILADLRESGQIEQDADVVIFIYQDPKEETVLNVDFAKGRNIGLGTVKLYFDKEIMTFRDIGE